MNKILLIIQREYLSRVKKRTFLLTTFLVPFFFIALYVGVFFLTKQSFESTKALVYVVDHTDKVASQLTSSNKLTFTPSAVALNEQIAQIKSKDDNTNILIIPEDFLENHQTEFLSSGKPNINTQSEIESQLEEIVLNDQYSKLDIDPAIVKNIDNKVKITAKEITESGEAKESDTHIAIGIAIGFSILIYLSLFIYGSQVMRGIIEEKSSRIIEIIISSVKP